MSSTQAPTPAMLLQAEKQVLAGIYGRLLDRYRNRFGSETAAGLARAVTDSLFGHTVQDEPALDFLSAHRNLVEDEIMNLKNDDEIRSVVTDTFVLKAVFLHRQRGCKDTSYVDPVERIKRFGLYLEGQQPPTPMSFIKTAREFYQSTPPRKADISA